MLGNHSSFGGFISLYRRAFRSTHCKDLGKGETSIFFPLQCLELRSLVDVIETFAEVKHCLGHFFSLYATYLFFYTFIEKEIHIFH